MSAMILLKVNNASFLIKQEFIKLSQLAKNQEKSKQHPEADILLLKTFSLSSSSLSSKNNRRYSKKCAKKTRPSL